MTRLFPFLGLALSLLPSLFLASTALAADVRGSADHPLIGRFAGSQISYYKTYDFDELTIPTGPARNRKFTKSVRPEGKKTVIAYRISKGPSLLEVARNFRLRMEEKGFEVLYECKHDKCGRTSFAHNIAVAPLPAMLVDPFNFRYLAAKRSADGRETHAFVLVSLYNGKLYAQVSAVESGTMKFRMVDARKMAADIETAGRVALYGIHFDFDKAIIRPDSKRTLDEIAKLLKTRPRLKLIVVGHTDNKGGWDYNMTLSSRRAAAVVRALTGRYGIAKGRLRSAGVGFLAPVAPNDAEDGRARNRRVELIKG